MGTPNQNSCQFEVCIRRKKIISQSWQIPDPPASYFYNAPIFISMDEKSWRISQPWETPHQSAFPPITPLCAYPTQHYPSMPASSGTLLAQLDIYLDIFYTCINMHYPSMPSSTLPLYTQLKQNINCPLPFYPYPTPIQKIPQKTHKKHSMQRKARLSENQPKKHKMEFVRKKSTLPAFDIL